MEKKKKKRNNGRFEKKKNVRWVYFFLKKNYN